MRLRKVPPPFPYSLALLLDLYLNILFSLFYRNTGKRRGRRASAESTKSRIQETCKTDFGTFSKETIPDTE
jgi:hypothetical protein